MTDLIQYLQNNSLQNPLVQYPNLHGCNRGETGGCCSHDTRVFAREDLSQVESQGHEGSVAPPDGGGEDREAEEGSTTARPLRAHAGEHKPQGPGRSRDAGYLEEETDFNLYPCWVFMIMPMHTE